MANSSAEREVETLFCIVAMHMWLADYVYTGGRFEPGLAMIIGENGVITEASSREQEDLDAAHRLPGRAMLPGLVNVHSHTFQRLIRGRTEHRTSAGSRHVLDLARKHVSRRECDVAGRDVYHAARMAFLRK